MWTARKFTGYHGTKQVEGKKLYAYIYFYNGHVDWIVIDDGNWPNDKFKIFKRENSEFFFTVVYLNSTWFNFCLKVNGCLKARMQLTGNWNWGYSLLELTTLSDTIKYADFKRQ